MPSVAEIHGSQSAAAIESLLQSHEQAWNRHDRGAYEALFTEDADFVNVVGQHAVGRTAIGNDFEHLHRTFMRNSHVKLLHSTIRFVHPTVAIVRIRWEMTGVDKVPGWNVPDVRKGILTYVAVESGKDWKITAVQNTDELNLDGSREE